MDLLERLQHIESKLRNLQSDRLQLKDENERLQLQITELEGRLKAEQERTINLEEQNKITKLAGGLSQDQDSDELRQELDRLIQEIDQCIKLVKR